MVYAVGVIGFICGFFAGQMLLAFLLRNRSNKELTSDSSLKVYGLLNWLVAAGGAAAFVMIYRQYYGLG